MFYISKLLNKNRFTSTVSKYVDLIDNTIKNGYLFNKYTDKIVDKYAIFDIITNRNYMILNKMAYLNTNYSTLPTRKWENYNGIIQDKDNINIFYIMSSGRNTIHICNTKDKTLDNIYINSVGNDAISDFIGQDDEFVYFFSHSSYDSSGDYGKCEINKLDKRKLTILSSPMLNFNGDFPYVEKGQYDNEIIFYNTYNNYFYKRTVDLIQGRVISSISKSISQNQSKYASCEIVSSVDEKNLYFVTNNNISSSGNNVNFNFYRYNKKDNTLESLETDKNVLTSLYGSYYQFRTFVIEKQGKEYLVFAPTCINNNRTYGESQANEQFTNGVRLYLFEIEENRLRLIDEMQSQSIAYTNMIYQKDIGLFVWANYKHINFIIVNDDLQFESVYLHNGLFETFGICNENDVYVQNYDSSIDKLDRGSDVVVRCYFEKKVSLYKGIPINSFMEVEIKNFLGESLKREVILTLQGNITFEDGSKIKEVTTSNTGKLRVPIIIKTNTRFDCNVKIKEK